MSLVATKTGHISPNTTSIWMNGLMAAAISVLLNVVLFLLGRATNLIPESVEVQSPTGEGALSIEPVILMSIVPVVVSVLVYPLLRRTTVRPVRVFRIVGGGLLVLSLLLPWGIPDVPARMALMLDLMHVVCGLAILILVPRADER